MTDRTVAKLKGRIKDWPVDVTVEIIDKGDAIPAKTADGEEFKAFTSEIRISLLSQIDVNLAAIDKRLREGEDIKHLELLGIDIESLEPVE